MPTLLALVADGMGGHAAGEVASGLAADILVDAYGGVAPANPVHWLEQSFNQANAMILEAATLDPDCARMGTTLTALIISGGKLWFAHIGDSRLYHIRGRKIESLTQDHSLAMQHVYSGMISVAEAAKHPDRNVLTQAMGIDPEIEIDVSIEPITLHGEDAFLLCTDGLYDLVADDEIAEILAYKTPDRACRKLVELAKSRGAHDNVTLCIIKVRDHG